MKFLNDIDSDQNEVTQHRLHNLSSPPGTPVVGQIYYDTAYNRSYIWNGTVWVEITRNNAYDLYTTTGTTTSTTFSAYRTWTTPIIVAGTYRIGWSLLWQHSTANQNSEFKVTVDGASIWNSIVRNPQANVLRQSITAFDYIVFPTTTTYSIALNFRITGSGTLSVFENSFELTGF
ncbi:MAG: hypothetical protein WC511_03025 [Candidatus Pacearchaeota archaeon]